MKSAFGGRLLRSSGAATFSNLGRFVVTFATHAVLRRLIDPSGWGLWHWAVDFLFLLAGQVRDLGLPAQVVRADDKLYGSYLRIQLWWGGALALGLAGAAPLLARAVVDPIPETVPVLQALALFLFIEGLGKVPVTFFEAEIRIGRVVWPEVARNLCFAGIAIALALAGHGIWSMVIAHVAAASVFAATVWLRAAGEIPLDRGRLAPLLRPSLPLMAMALLLLAVEMVDYQILGDRLEPAMVGTYGGALMLALMIPRLIEHPLRRALYPSFVAVRNDAARFFATYRLGTLFLLGLQVPFALLLICNAETILSLVWGAQYAGAGDVLRLLALVPLVQPLARIAEDVLLTRHEERYLLAAAAINLALLVGLGLWWTASHGAIGMAWAKLVPLGTLVLSWAIYRVDPRRCRALLGDLAKLYAIPLPFFAGAMWLADASPAWRLGLSLAAAATTLCAYAWIWGSAFSSFFRGETEAR